MNTIEHIRVYDFDDTLFFSPKPDENGKGEYIFRYENINGVNKKFSVSKEYEKSTGEPWPYRGWWGRKESLDTKVFDIKKNNFVYNKYTNDKNGVGKYVVLMTGRLKSLRKEVIDILESNNMKFDDYYFNPGNVGTIDYKIGVFDKFIDDNPNLKSLKMYDDRNEHIPIFIEWAEKIMIRTDIDIEVIHIRGENRVN